MKMLHLPVLSIIALSTVFSPLSYSVQTIEEKAETKRNENTDLIKKTYRNIDNEICEVINGKIKCIGKKISNKTKDFVDKTKTKSKEIKNKID